jgi:glycosyltransferase involved in cell wall biosynthesis
VPRISLVIPAYNEQAALPRLLDSIDLARQRYRTEIEVIVADNASTDRTPDIAHSRGCTVVHVQKRAIAAARNAGAHAATGEILAFVDADSSIHPDTFNAIDDAMGKGHAIVGATSARYDRTSFGIAFTTLCATIVFAVTRLDTGVVFCLRKDWQSAGGYDESRLWAEDICFLFALKRLGRPFVRLKNVRAVTSARKFDRFGDWHAFALPLNLFRVDFVQRYWYRQRSKT